MKIVVPIYSTPTGSYQAWTVAWRIGGERKRKKFAKKARAQEFADDLAEKIANQKASADQLTFEESSEYREAKKVHPGPLVPALREFTRQRSTHSGTVAETIRDMLGNRRLEIRRRPFNAEYLRNMEQRLNTFAAAFPVNLERIDAEQIQAWLANLGVGLRTKNNYLDDVRALIRWCVKQKRLPKDFDELDRVSLQRAGPGRIQPYTPEEAAAILDHAQAKAGHWLPYLPVRMFSGVRGAEAMRLQKSAFQGHEWIAADASITKTEARRLIPILPNLKAWLRAYKPSNALSPKPDTARTCPALTRLIRGAGVEPRNNGFRDSYVSYRMADLRDAAVVSEETGHSTRQLRRSYMELRLKDGRVITPGLAKEYFAIRP